MKHKKGLLVTLVVLAIFVIVVIALVTTAYVDDVKDLETEVNNQFLQSWQQHIEDDTKLNEMVMPGSHDSGCNNMMPLARTQAHDIIDQLNGGVRYLDLRVTNKGDDLVIFHGPIKGQKFSKVLADINTFIANNPTEFLVLDFQHLGKNVNEAVLDAITSTLPMQKAMLKSQFANIEDTSIGEIRNNNVNFVIVWNNEEECNNADYLYFRDTNLYSFYDGKVHRNVDTFVLIKHFATYYDRYQNKGFFVLQSQRTAPMLLDKPSNLEREAKSSFNSFLETVKTNSALLDKTNIVMRDFIVSDLNTVKLILSLNINKNQIKESSLETFTTNTTLN